MRLNDSDLICGLAGATVEVDQFDLGEGVSISKTFAHLFAPFLVAFERPDSRPWHPGPWKPANGGFAFDIAAEIRIPRELSRAEWSQPLDVAQWLIALLRLRASTEVFMPLAASESLSNAAQATHQIHFWPIEVYAPTIRPADKPPAVVTEADLAWVKEHWPIGAALMRKSAAFSLLVRATDRVAFADDFRLALLSLWGALEAVFSPSRAELRFRISALIATFLEPAGEDRRALQRHLVKLYDDRSKATHGGSGSFQEALFQTFTIARAVVRNSLERNRVPSPEKLEDELFGVDPEE